MSVMVSLSSNKANNSDKPAHQSLNQSHLPTMSVVATIFAESIHLDASEYLTTLGLIPLDDISLHASSTCMIPNSLKASSRFVRNNGLVLIMPSASRMLSPALIM